MTPEHKRSLRKMKILAVTVISLFYLAIFTTPDGPNWQRTVLIWSGFGMSFFLGIQAWETYRRIQELQKMLDDKTSRPK